jgi:hypothetical protein
MSRLVLNVVDEEVPATKEAMKLLVDEELACFDLWWAEQPGHEDPMHPLERMLLATYLVQKLQGRIP